MKLKEMEIKDSIETLLATGLFKPYMKNHLCDDGYCIPQHLVFLNSNFYFYVDHRFPFYVNDRKTTITIVDFSKKERPHISIEDFISRLSNKESSKFFFYLDLFI